MGAVPEFGEHTEAIRAEFGADFLLAPSVRPMCGGGPPLI